MKISASGLAVVTGGTLSGDKSVAATGIMTDSRSSGAGHDLLFVALRGPNHDGHRFIEPLYDRGVRLFLVENLPDNQEFMTGAAFVKVNDTLEALHLLAAQKRNDFRGKVIAVTGSTGKTIVKEWLSETMGTRRRVIRSPRSYNSQLGVALSLLNIDDRYDVAIIEAGISRPGEMIKLAHIIRPDTVVITNIGDAHRENFSSREEIAAEKLLLAAGAGLIIYSTDDKIIKGEVDRKYSHIPAFTWSLSGSGASLSVRVSEKSGGQQVLECVTGESSFSVIIPFADRASAENAASVMACCLSEGIPDDIIIKAVEGLPAVAMRMEIKKGINGCTLIEDYYNSDPGSLIMALDFLRTHARGRTALILSDFRQIGGDEKRLYEGVAEAVRKTGIDRFIGVGEALCRQCGLFPEGSSFFASTADFNDTFRSITFRNETILIKGARAFGFERISSLLVQQLHLTRLEINMNAVVHNLNEFRRLLNPGTGIMAMVKAFAYGSGSSEIASLLEYNRVNYFAVAYVDEGIALREAGITAPVMVMNPDESAMEMIIRHNLEPEIYSMESYNSFLRSAKRYGLLNYPVHIKIDTGMHRLGFNISEVNLLADMLPSEQHFRVVSLFSHLSASENPLYDDFTHRQAALLSQAAARLGKSLGYTIRLHLLNSAGISRFPEYQFDMVRIGIGLYGVGEFSGVSLRHTGRFVTAVSQVRTVAAGEPVSYGCNGATEYEREIAVIPVGYADGLRRELGNGRGSLF
ncbi:MAG: bifunctional UDP-N-acetylmuramoyl-tripeptide:D-alanyl-D-alanine ligase/alanine racemase, partial [Bacteroidales bacterium]|nr:bifunctional UDP-N-acetylmuramoyl-tripeptide:D-alanyl-D-alanine ligase/alanine racemase [Bacteroidales bacterium]